MGKKKEKITYIDDGRTIADMSGISGGFQHESRPKYQPRAGIKEQLSTLYHQTAGSSTEPAVSL